VVGHLDELLEDVLQVLGGDADPGVLHGEDDLAVHGGRPQSHRPPLGELHRVGQQVARDPRDEPPVGDERDACGVVHDQLDAVAHQRRGGAAELVEQRGEVDGGGLHVQVPGLGAGELQQLVHQRQQGARAVREEPDLVGLRGVEPRLREQGGEPDDRVHGRAQLVADVAQEP
jgi:hypothetical protein